MGRFINADVFVSTGQGIVGNNMFAYCGNNPVNCLDLQGKEPIVIGGDLEWWKLFVGSLPLWDGPLPIGDLLATGFVIYLFLETGSDSKTTSYRSDSDSIANDQSSFVSDYGSTTASPPGPGNNRDNKYRGGSTYNKNGIRIDYEYYGNGEGNVHIHINGQKFRYDINSHSFRSPNNEYAPRYVQSLLKDIEILKSIEKAIKYIS